MRNTLRLAARLLTAGVCLAVAVACSQDPEIAKQEYFGSGNSYFDEESYQEAVIEYANAIDLDPQFGEARLRLAETLLRLDAPQQAFGHQIRAETCFRTTSTRK